MHSFSPTRWTPPQGWELGFSHQRFPDLPDHIWASTKEWTEGRSHTFPVVTARAGAEWMRGVLRG